MTVPEKIFFKWWLCLHEWWDRNLLKSSRQGRRQIQDEGRDANHFHPYPQAKEKSWCFRKNEPWKLTWATVVTSLTWQVYCLYPGQWELQLTSREAQGSACDPSGCWITCDWNEVPPGQAPSLTGWRLVVETPKICGPTSTCWSCGSLLEEFYKASGLCLRAWWEVFAELSALFVSAKLPP